jgi:hypothetical protein
MVTAAWAGDGDDPVEAGSVDGVAVGITVGGAGLRGVAGAHAAAMTTTAPAAR